MLQLASGTARDIFLRAVVHFARDLLMRELPGMQTFYKFHKIVGVQSRNKCSLGNVERKEWAGLFL
jgi:hypothetical protein